MRLEVANRLISYVARSRSSSPTKKQPTPESTLETNAETAFPHAPMETMAEEPEPGA